MQKNLKSILGLTVLVLVLAGALWVIVFFGSRYTQKSADPSPPASPQSEQVTASVPLDKANLEVSIKPGDFLPNPFGFKSTSTFMENRDWILQDSSGAIIASGTIPGLLSSYSSLGDVYWYADFPAGEMGEFIILPILDKPQIIIPVNLETNTQTVEIYFRPAMLSNYGGVEPVKRTIVSTGANDLFYYEAAIRELLKGPNQTESEQGLVTMVPDIAQVIRVGKTEKGRYVADFTSELKDPNQIDCFWLIAQEQIKKTLKTVPLPGHALDGEILINGENIE